MFVKLINSSLSDSSKDFKYSEGKHSGHFTIIKTCFASNWARMTDTRYYAEVLSYENLQQVDLDEYTCTEMSLGELKDIWLHPNYNFEYYYMDVPKLLGLVPNLSEEFCIKVVTKNWSLLTYLKNPTDKVVLAAIAKGFTDLRKVERVTQEMADLAFKKNVECLNNIPKQFVTEEMQQKYDAHWKRMLNQKV